MNEPALNGGSSSVKFRLLAVEPGAPAPAARSLASSWWRCTIRTLVITADEERIIAHETAACLARARAARSHP